MPPGAKEYGTVAKMGAVMVVTQALALLLAFPFKNAGFQAFEDPGDPMNPFLYLAAIMLFTGMILLIVKLGKKGIIKALILFATWAVLLDVFMLGFAYLFYYWFGIDYIVPGFGLWELSFVFAAMLSSAITYALVIFPEWYVVNGVGILVGAGVASILGISLWILPMLILLIALAVYDAISVYKTKHMISLADAVTEQHLPVLMVFPKDENYTFMEQKGIKQEIDSGKEREAMFIGLGDIVIPGALVVSAFVNLPWDGDGILAKPLLVAIGTMAGILVGFSMLMRYVLKGNPQAGLPLLNGGAIAGYALSYVLAYGTFTFGISW
jgi:presenilin-like A22 family membrane protease